MNKKVKALICLFTAFSLGMALHGNAKQAAQKNKLYVPPAGNDKNTGSKKKPLKTLQQAVNSAKPGSNRKQQCLLPAQRRERNALDLLGRKRNYGILCL